ncbi:hypothetical protein SB783_42300, partial [Paraburkholderia sp. SIMBA_009]
IAADKIAADEKRIKNRTPFELVNTRVDLDVRYAGSKAQVRNLTGNFVIGKTVGDAIRGKLTGQYIVQASQDGITRARLYGNKTGKDIEEFVLNNLQ